jgi:hypothetical protein
MPGGVITLMELSSNENISQNLLSSHAKIAPVQRSTAKLRAGFRRDGYHPEP